MLPAGAAQGGGGRLLGLLGRGAFRPGGGDLRLGRGRGALRLPAGGVTVALHFVEGGAESLPAQGTRRCRVEPVGRSGLGGGGLDPPPYRRQRRLGGGQAARRLPGPVPGIGGRLLQNLQCLQPVPAPVPAAGPLLP